MATAACQYTEEIGFACHSWCIMDVYHWNLDNLDHNPTPMLQIPIVTVLKWFKRRRQLKE